mgnify:CR=1 FL=1
MALTVNPSCENYTSEALDKGVVNEVHNQFDWHNTYVGHDALADGLGLLPGQVLVLVLRFSLLRHERDLDFLDQEELRVVEEGTTQNLPVDTQ